MARTIRSISVKANKSPREDSILDRREPRRNHVRNAPDTQDFDIYGSDYERSHHDHGLDLSTMNFD